MIRYGEALGEEVTEAKLLTTSQEAFGQEDYGQLAVDIIDRLRRDAFIGVSYRATDWDVTTDTAREYSRPHISAYGLGHNPSGGIYHRLFDGKPATTATVHDIQEELFPLLADRPLYFDYLFIEDPDARYWPNSRGERRAMMIPVSLTKEALGRYMTSNRTGTLNYPEDYRPAKLSEHELHGAVGRALDILLYVSGVSGDIDPASTEPQSELVNFDEFRNGYLKFFASPGARTNFQNKVRGIVATQVRLGRSGTDGFEVVVDGNVRYGTRPGVAASFDSIAVDSLREYGNHFGGSVIREALKKL